MDVVLGLLAFAVGSILASFAGATFDLPGLVLSTLIYLVSLVVGVYLVVRGLGKLVEDIVRHEVTNRA